MFRSFTLMYEVTVDLLHAAQTGSVSVFLSYSNTDIHVLLKNECVIYSLLLLERCCCE